MKEYVLKIKDYYVGGKLYSINLDYLPFIPDGFESWFEWSDPLERKEPCTVKIVHTVSTFTTKIFVRTIISKDAFHRDFFLEDLAMDFHVFGICTNSKEPEKEFIIPLW